MAPQTLSSPQSFKQLQTDLRIFKLFEIAIALVCLLIPVLLRLADLDYNGFRDSISAYVEMPRSEMFGMLLAIAAMLFMVNGAVYFQNERKGWVTERYGKWYNLILGTALLGVIIFPYNTLGTIHLIFAAVFFLGNAVVIMIFHQRRYRGISITLGLLTIGVFILTALKMMTLFWAEWLSLIVIGVHFILQATGIISFTRQHHFIRKSGTK